MPYIAMISPTAIDIATRISGIVSPKANLNTNGTIMAFDKIVGNILRVKLFTFINLIHNKPKNVASVPKIASIIPLNSKLERKQPTDTDIIAVSSNIGNMHNTSAILTWTAAKLMGWNIAHKAT